MAPVRAWRSRRKMSGRKSLMAFSVVACGKSDDGDSKKKDDKKNESSSKKDDKDSKGDSKDDSKGDSKGDGVIEKIIGDKVPLAEGGQAHDSWHALTTYRTYEFSKDGKCTKSEDIYYIDDPSNYDEANDRLTSSNFKPEWSADKTYFSLDNQYISYTETDDAIEYYASRYTRFSTTTALRSMSTSRILQRRLLTSRKSTVFPLMP